jgi:hypothetical protein
MKKHGGMGTRLAVVAAGLAVHSLVTGCQAGDPGKAVPGDQQERLEAMRAEGTRASLTVYPVVMGEEAVTDVAGVLALLLEQAGMKELGLSNAVLRLPAGATFEEAPALFGAFVRQSPPGTEYALYAEFIGDPTTGPKEIRGVIVDKSGQTVWVDRQTASDRALRRARPDCPMDCCVFLAERVRKGLGIPKSARDESGEGRIARRLAKDSPVPDKAEWSALERRQEAMKKAGRSATVVVFPVRLADDEVGQEEAARLAELLNEERLCAAGAVESPWRVKTAHSRNEQKVLWDLARAFQAHVKQNPPEADYALLADYIMRPEERRAWAVHFVVCDRRGEWVIVDFQNGHHGDFQSIDPKTYDDCGRLVARRVQGYLR